MLVLIVGRVWLAVIDDRPHPPHCDIFRDKTQHQQSECENGKYCHHRDPGVVGQLTAAGCSLCNIGDRIRSRIGWGRSDMLCLNRCTLGYGIGPRSGRGKPFTRLVASLRQRGCL